eukprot:GDKI01047130.1.p1 GENE.GDKI01047130.1~~GDKI01047130.1.p1  ORF type:complete len:651 (+),score=200.24 GDKI01047130.1:202-2154(+)
MTEMWNYPKQGTPFKKGGRYFYFYNTGLQNHHVLYVMDSLSDENPRVLLDPNTLSEDGTIALSSYSFSEDGETLAYSLSKSGSDWTTIHFVKVSDGTQLADVLCDVKFSCLEWTHDHKGVFYNRFDKTGAAEDMGTETTIVEGQKLYYHVLGTPQKTDTLCWEYPEDPKLMAGVTVSDCGEFLILSMREGCRPASRIWYTTLGGGVGGVKERWVRVIDTFEQGEYDYIANEGRMFTFKTNCKADKCRIVAFDLDHPDESNWKTIIAEHPTDVLQSALCVHHTKLIVTYMHDVCSAMALCELKTGAKLRDIPLEIGALQRVTGSTKNSEVFFSMASFVSPGSVFTFDLETAREETFGDMEVKLWKRTEVGGFDAGLYEQKQVFVTSKDGTRVPMFVVHKKGLVLDGSAPCLLYGYGGFSISITPYFSVAWVLWMSHFNGIVCVANIRGGDEYGEEWHNAGTKERKQNVFDDFQSAAEYLIAHKYTTHTKLAINGGSNGGLLVGACVNQRPDLFGCGVAQVGVLDMLRFHKFTIGHAWTTDYGCADHKDDFAYLYKYSPLHNVKVPEKEGVQYPAVLLMTADHDDRVVPLHSLKYAAELQYRLGGVEKQTNPLMILVDTKAGHGAGKPTKKKIEESADMYSFIAKSLNIQWQ